MTIVAGDIAFVGVNSADPDEVAILVRTTLAAGDTFFLTDGGFTGATGAASAMFRATEGFLQYTAPTGGLAAGSVIVITGGGGSAPSVVRNGGGAAGSVTLLGNSSNATNNFAFSTSGDSLTAYTVTGGTHLTGTPALIAFLDYGVNPYGSGSAQASSIPTISGGQVLDLANLDDAIVINTSSAYSLTLAQLSSASSFSQQDGTRYTLSSIASKATDTTATVSVDSVSITEGNSGTSTLTFTVTRSDTTGSFDIDFATANGTATAGSDYVAQSGTLHFTAGGGASQQVSVVVNGDTAAEADESFSLTLSNLVNGTGTATLGTATGTGTITNDDVALVKIYDIQGAGHKSSYVGGAVGSSGNSGTVRVNVEGVVTAIAANGFYMQDATGDGNVNTSDGIFVFTNTSGTNYTAGQALSVGNTVRVLGARVDEFRPGSDLTITELSITSTITGASLQNLGGNTAITAVDLGTDRTIPTGAIDSDNFSSFNPGTDAIDFWESLEGMKVQVTNPITVSATNEFRTQLDSNTAGPPSEEIWVVAPGAFDAGSQTSRGGLIIGATDYNPERIQLDDMLASLDLPSVDVGAQLSTVTGVVNYDFGNYEVLVTTAPTVVTASTLTRETTTITRGNHQLTIADYNVQNLDAEVENLAAWGTGGVAADGTGGVTGSTSSNASGTLYVRLSNSDDDVGTGKYALHAQQIAQNLGAPTIVALQEIQDDDGAEISSVLGSDRTLSTLVDLIKTTYGVDYAYAYLAPSASNINGGQPNANIRNGFLYRADLVTLNSVELLDPTNSAFASSRKPLIGHFTFNGQDLTVINLHMNSKGGDGALFGAIQPPVLGSETQRLAQATVINAYIDSLLASNPNALIQVAGDLNDFTFSNPVKTLTGESTGAQVVFDLAAAKLPTNEQYSYNFDGNTQELDHQLASATLLAANDGFDIVHINSEFYAQASDHDPSLARYDFSGFAEVLAGTSGADSLDGQGGNDSLTGGTGNDTLDGGTGDDVAVFAGTSADTTLVQNLDGSWTAIGAAGRDLLRHVEVASFADGNVTLAAGTPGPQTVQLVQDSGLAGDLLTNDGHVSGTALALAGISITEGGIEVASTTADASGAWSLDLSALAQGSHSLTVSQTDAQGASSGIAFSFTLDTLAPAVAITSPGGTVGVAAQTITGTAEAGATVQLYEGLVAVGAATIAGADGTWSVGVTLTAGAHTLAAQAIDAAGNAALGASSLSVTFVPPSRTIGTRGDDLLTGAEGFDTLSGLTGNDTLLGLEGNDSLDGGTGADSMVGGDGNDGYMVDNAADQVVELADQGTDTVRTALNGYVLAANVEVLTLTGTADQDGSGNAGDNLILGTAGNNALAGLGGNDSMMGNAGNDTLNGGTGADTMSGGIGDDTYYVDSLADMIRESGVGVDTVVASINYTLGRDLEALVLDGGDLMGTGNTGANSLTGSAGSNTLLGLAGDDTLLGLGGNDSLDGGTGADSMVGGTGDDTYVVDSVGDLAVEASGVGGGMDLVKASVSFTLGANVEALTLTGRLGINGTGNELGNLLTGNAGANQLSGAAGNDTLVGGAGRDTLAGGNDADIFRYATASEGNDRVLDFQHGVDAFEFDAAGFDASLTAGMDLGAAQRFVAGNAANKAWGQFVYSTSANTLYWDADGTGAGVKMIIASFATPAGVTASDLHLI